MKLPTPAPLHVMAQEVDSLQIHLSYEARTPLGQALYLIHLCNPGPSAHRVPGEGQTSPLQPLLCRQLQGPPWSTLHVGSSQGQR